MFLLATLFWTEPLFHNTCKMLCEWNDKTMIQNQCQTRGGSARSSRGEPRTSHPTHQQAVAKSTAISAGSSQGAQQHDPAQQCTAVSITTLLTSHLYSRLIWNNRQATEAARDSNTKFLPLPFFQAHWKLQRHKIQILYSSFLRADIQALPHENCRWACTYTRSCAAYIYLLFFFTLLLSSYGTIHFVTPWVDLERTWLKRER